MTGTIRTFLLVALGVSVISLPGSSQEVPRELKGREFMRRKLEHSQRVLEGIALEDFELIEKNARTLTLLSQAAEWQILPSAEYRKHSEEFRRTSEALIKAAREKNLDGAALGYVQLTLNCVECHKYVRAFPADERRKPAPGDVREKPVNVSKPQ